MEDNFRNALIIISAVIIAAIFVHGLWTIRKHKNPYKLKAKPEQVGDIERSFDGTGFDQDGVGQPKVVGKNYRHNAHAANGTASIADESAITATEQALTSVPTEPEPSEPSLGEIEQIEEFHIQAVSTPLVKQQAEPLVTPVKVATTMASTEPQHNRATPVYQDPVIQAKPKTKMASVASAKELKRNQMEIDFAAEQSREQSPTSAKSPAVETTEPEFLVISVLAPEQQMISGAALLPSLLTLGMRYGEMNIFHRHQDNAGNGEITFSLANMLNPGTFDLNQMETFMTKGISLFMSLPNAGKPAEVFEQMISAARQLAQEFNGQLLDDKRSVFTPQTEQHYQSKIREFERKSRIAISQG